MEVSLSTLIVLYYGVFLYIFYMINHAFKMHHITKLIASLPSLLFVLLFPYVLDADLFLKFLLTVIGFFTSFNIVDLVYLDPVEHMSFKEYMFYLSTSSRFDSSHHLKEVKEKEMEQKNDEPLQSSPLSINTKGLWRLVKAVGKFIVLATVLESLQKWDFRTSNVKYYTFMYLLCGCLYVCFNVLLDVVGLVWEFAFNMKPKELFNAPFMASSPRDFWSRRWNMFFRDFFHKIFFKNIKTLSYSRSILSALAIFAISGLLHEYVYWSIMGKITGLNFMFFMLHGFATTFQAIIQITFPALKRIPLFIAIPINTVFLALTTPLFVDPYLQSGFIRNVRLPFSLMPTLNSAVAELSSYYVY